MPKVNGANVGHLSYCCYCALNMAFFISLFHLLVLGHSLSVYGKG